MNVEVAYIKSTEVERVIKIAEERLKGNLNDIHSDYQIEVPDSYDTVLAKDDKRKIAISAPQNGWITIIESKEVNDYAMLLHMSKELQTEVLAVLQYDIAGAWGFVEISQGVVQNSYFSEEDDIEDLLESKLEEKSISEPLYMFREVVREKENHWNIVQKPKQAIKGKIEQETQTTETEREETPAKEKEKTIDMSRYGYYPEDKKKLEINEVIWKMWDFRLLIILAVPVWVLWFFHTLGILYICYTYDATLTDWIGFGFIFFISCIIALGVTVVPIFIARFMDEKKRILKNIHKYLPDVGDDFLEQLQADLYKGLRFMKRHNLVISDRYVIGTITDLVLNPMVIPKDQIQEIAYANYRIVTLKFYIVIKEVYFRLKNGKEIKMPVGDWDGLGLTLRALADCGVPIIDISQEKKNSR